VKVYRREFVIQASLYVLAYIAPIFFFLYSTINLVIVKRRPNDVLVLLASIFYPLGGLFNIVTILNSSIAFRQLRVLVRQHAKEGCGTKKCPMVMNVYGTGGCYNCRNE
jgi:hypothetical protein